MTRKVLQVSFSFFLLVGFISGLVQPYPAQAARTDQQTYSTAPLTIKNAGALQEGNPPKNTGGGAAELGVAPVVEKSEEDSTAGSGLLATWPGPDGYQYQGSACTYTWVDITGTGTAIPGLTDDNFMGPFNVGFSFPFYESSYTQFYAGSNGFLSFGSGSSTLTNQCPLPNATTPNNILSLLWDDLNFGVSGNAYYQNFGSCPVGSGACTVVEYYNVAHYGGAGLAGTWEAILYPSGKVVMQFLDSGVESGLESTTGIENANAAAGYGLTYACNVANSVADNTCIAYTRESMPNLSKSSKAAPALVSPGDLITYTVSVKNTGNADATSATMVDPIPAGAVFDHTVTPGLSYNSGLNQVEWSGSVAQATTVDLTFVVAVETSTACDASINNTAVISDPATLAPVIVQAASGVYDRIFYGETFESSNGGFTTSGTTTWAWGTVGPYGGTRPDFPAGAHSGSKAWATNLTGDYNNSENGYLTSPVIDLSTAVGIPGYPLELEWWQWLSSEGGFDYASVEVRGGSLPWTVVYGPEDGPIDLVWTRHVLDISDFAGASDFQVRFHFLSDSSVYYPGWYVDDLAVHQCAVPEGLYLSPDEITSQGCAGSDETFTLGLYNNTGAGGTFDLSYDLDPAFGTLTGPASLALGDGEGASFDVTLSMVVCLPGGAVAEGSVTATGNGYSDTTTIQKSAQTGGIWSNIADEPDNGRMDNVLGAYDDKVWSITGYGGNLNVRNYDPGSDSWTSVGTPAPFGGNYARSGCQAGSKVFVYGDAATSGFTGLWSYDMATTTWAQVTPSGTPPAQTGIWAPAWAYDEDAGYCYLTGGATLPGAGNLTTVYVYNPAGNAWLSPLPNFTSIRDFHAAFVFERPSDAHKLLCVLGGNNNNVGLTSTQCYDFNQAAWNAENADLGALPTDAWGMGYATKLHGGTQPQLWLLNGVVGGSLSAGTLYYDVNAGSWEDGGTLDHPATYRTAAVTLNNEIYKVSGSIGSFVYQGVSDRHFQCQVCTEVGWLQGHVYDYNDVEPPVTPAHVHLEPGNIDIPVDANGYYTATLAPFTYEATAEAVDYPNPAGPVDVVVVNDQTTTQDFLLDRPDIDVNPTSLSAAIVADGTDTQYFTITNEGTLPLMFEIREAQATAAANAMSNANPFGAERSNPGGGQIEVEPELLAKLDQDGTTGYLIYFRATPDLSPAFGMDWITRGRYVVKALQETAGQSQASVRAYLDARGASYKSFWIDNIIVVDASNRSTFDGLLAFPEIASLRARRTMGLILPEVDPLAAINQILAIEPNITHVGADQVWAQGFTGQGMVVASIDTGVRYTHQALVDHYRGNLGGGTFDHNYNWWDPFGVHPTQPADDQGHGSHTMGTMIGDDGGANQIGMAPGAKWIACLGCDATIGCTDAALLGCAQFMASPTNLAGTNPNPDLRPNAVNNSWGDCGTTYNNWYQGVVNSWHAAGIYPIFANGNASNCGYDEPPGLNTVGNPARYGNVSGVGSSGQQDGQYATHSNWGPTDNPDTVNPHPGWADIKPQFLAPGVNIRSSFNSGDTAYQGGWSGTSMSAPHVTGLVALMWSAAPCLVGDYAATETIIENTATPISYNDGGGARFPNYATGWGEINALAAVEAAAQFCGTDFLPWVSFSPVTGTVSAPGTQVVEVTFTCGFTESQQTQPLEGVLHVGHNDPELPNPRDVNLSMFCISQDPLPNWDKEVRLNGVVVDYTAGPLVVRPDDIVTVVDWVGATFSLPVSAELQEVWGDGLTLVAADTDGVGSLSVGANNMVWTLEDVAPNTLYPITKTFAVLYGVWTTDVLHESFTVEGALAQLPDKDVHFEQYVPALQLVKDGLPEAVAGSPIPVTLTITSHNFGGTAVLTDTLPAGMTYAGGLTASYGEAWVTGDVIHWTNITATLGLLNMPEDILLTEGFEGGVVPPAGWTRVQNNPNHTWGVATYAPHTGTYYANIEYDDALLQQNEWLLSPSMSLTQATLSFWSYGSLYWCRDTYDNCDLNVWIVVGPTAGDGDDIFVGKGDDVWATNWTWAQSTFDLTPLLPGGPVRIGFQYDGLDGAEVALDDVLLDGSTNPPMPDTVTITFDVTVTGNPFEVIRNTAVLNWGIDWTSDILDVMISGWKFFMPVILNAP